MRRLCNPTVAMITFLLGIWLAGLRLEPAQSLPKFQPEPIPISPNPESERYAVISALIRDMYVEGTKLIVIQHEGRCASPQAEALDEKVEQMRRQIEEYAFNAMPELKSETIDDFHAKAKECHPISQRLDIPRYVLVTEEDLAPLFPQAEYDRAWRKFYSRYPGSSGVISLSNVGFNREMSQALVSTGRGCGGLCGAGYFVLLKKDCGVWRVHHKINTWVS